MFEMGQFYIVKKNVEKDLLESRTVLHTLILPSEVITDLKKLLDLQDNESMCSLEVKRFEDVWNFVRKIDGEYFETDDEKVLEPIEWNFKRSVGDFLEENGTMMRFYDSYCEKECEFQLFLRFSSLRG